MKRLLPLCLIFAACDLPKPTPPAPSAPPPLSIEAIAESSACARYSWQDRGIAPHAYTVGTAKAYAAACHDKVDALGDSEHDALAKFGLQATQENVYLLLLGLGMRESSGKYCTGRDESAGATVADQVETGLFQFSYNSISADHGSADQSRLRQLYAYYKAHPAECGDEFRQDVSCPAHDGIEHGSGEGVAFQKLGKTCPAFAVKYAAILTRVLRRHFGPINRSEVEFPSVCRDMLKAVCQ